MFTWFKKRFQKSREIVFHNADGRPKKDIDMRLIFDLHEAGKSNREIAKVVGCSEGTIRNRLKQK